MTLLEQALGLKAFDRPELQRWQARKVHEEAAELMVAVDDWDKASGDEAAECWDHALDEYAQVLQALVNLQAAMGFTDADLRRSCRAVFVRHRAEGRCG